MKALTVQQPWAWAIVEADKVENRCWSTRHRGDVAIHAGARLDVTGFADPAISAATDGRRDLFPLGAIVGVGDLVDVHPATDSCVSGACAPFGWMAWENDPRKPMFHWVFERVRPLARPIPAKGRQRLWTLPPELLLQVVEGQVLAA